MLPLTGAGPSAGGETYAQKVLSYSPIAYWQLNDAAGAAVCSVNAAQNGTYTNCTLGQTGIGDGETAPLFDNNDCYVDIYSTTFRDAFDGTKGSVMAWAKVYNAAVWEDSVYRHIYRLYADAENRLTIDKEDANDKFRFRYESNNEVEQKFINSYTPTDWVHYVITWDDTGGTDIFKCYYDGGNEQTSTPIGTWALALTAAFIGSQDAGNAYWHGWIAHVAAFDTVLNTTQIADLAVV